MQQILVEERMSDKSHLSSLVTIETETLKAKLDAKLFCNYGVLKMKSWKSSWPLLAVLTLSVCALAQTPPKPAAGNAESKPPQFDLDEYQFGMLKRGPNWAPTTDANKAEHEQLQGGHMSNIQKMANLGKLMAAGPMGKNDLGLSGVFIFKSASMDEAKALAAADPAIKAGRLAIDFYTWWGPKGIGVKLLEDYRKDPNIKYTMTKYYLGMLKKGDNWSAQNTPVAQQHQLSHLWHIRRMLDTKQYVTAGPFDGKHEVLGIVVIDADSLAAAKTIAEADPAVKAGRFRVEYVEWWVAKEVWP